MTREEVADLMKIVKSKQTKRIYGIKDKMNATDWVAYFKFKAASYDVSYIPSEFKDVAIFRKLMKSFNKDEIQTMIDFIWDGGHFTNKDKSEYGIYMLSSNWLSSTYNLSQKWKNGEIESKKVKRGWKYNDSTGSKSVHL